MTDTSSPPTEAVSEVGPWGLIPLWVVEKCKGRPWAVMLYAQLAVHADRNHGNAWTISRKALAEELGASLETIDRMVKLLVEAKAITVTRNRKGKEWSWSRYTVWQVDRSMESSPTRLGVVTHDDIPYNPLQEPLSEVPSVDAAPKSKKERPPLPFKAESRQITIDFIDWYGQETSGGKPAQTFVVVQGIVRACLVREYHPDEITDAMKAERRALTSARVIHRIGEMRRAAENRPSTASIPAAVLRAVKEATPFFNGRWPFFLNEHRVEVLDCIATMGRWGYGIGESMIRMAVAMHAPLDALSPVTLSRVQGVDRFPGGLADPADAMERAYRNKFWRAA